MAEIRKRTVKSLGAITDNALFFDDHINTVWNAAHFHIRALRHIRRCESVNDAKNSGDRDGIISVILLQMNTVQHVIFQPQQVCRTP